MSLCAGYDDDSVGNRNFSLYYYLVAGRTYYLKVSAHSGYGSTTVTVERAYTICDSLSMSSCMTVFLGTSEGKYYSFILTTSGSYTFYSSSSSSDFDPEVILYDKDWSWLDDEYDDYENIVDGADPNFHLLYYLISGQTYYLEVFTPSHSGFTTIHIALT